MLPNIHQRELSAGADQVGALLDRLASPQDQLWPRKTWPAMRLDRPLGVGASGGHGPIRYSVEEYVPGERIVFRFAERGGLSEGLVGTHRLEVEALGPQRTLLRHVIDGRLEGMMRLKWPLLIEPLHDALIEDALDQAATAVGNAPQQQNYTLWVRLLRSAFRGIHRLRS